MRFVFYLTGIFYNVEGRVPAPYGEILNQYNPMAFLLTAMRQALIYEQTPQRKMLLIWFGVSIFLAAWGIRRIYREENSYVKVI